MSSESAETKNERRVKLSFTRKNTDVTITMSGNDFIIEVVRTKPDSVMEWLGEFMGKAPKSIISHPQDVLLAISVAAAYEGALEVVLPGSTAHVKAVLKFMWECVKLLSKPRNVNTAVQMYLIYLQTEAAGMYAYQAVLRGKYGGLVTDGFGKILTRGRGQLPAAAKVMLAMFGAAYRASCEMYNNYDSIPKNVRFNRSYPIFNAMVTGDIAPFDLAKEIGYDLYDKVTLYLHENPKAVKLSDPDLFFISSVVPEMVKFAEGQFDFVKANG